MYDLSPIREALVFANNEGKCGMSNLALDVIITTGTLILIHNMRN
jgi:hypothetical protein